MLLLPAIDLLEGKCVRLLRGDFSAARVYSADPASTARGLVKAGARALHVVDLDGARQGRPVHAGTITDIARAAGVPVQVGGGLRSFADVDAVLSGGAWRAILGTAALRDPDWTAEAVRRFGPGRVCVALDVRGDRPFAGGWTEAVAEPLEIVLDSLAAAGVRALVVTDIARDGALEGPNLDLYRRMAGFPFAVTAAGGVTRAHDLLSLAELGLAGAVIGRALYEGTVTLRELGRLSRELGDADSPGEPCS